MSAVDINKTKWNGATNIFALLLLDINVQWFDLLCKFYIEQIFFIVMVLVSKTQMVETSFKIL
jgi:hypothetical protein